MMMGTYDMPKFSLNNRKEVSFCAKAGCYKCCNIFEVKEINEYTDNGNTCLCPKCKFDTVVADMDGTLTEARLKKANNYWFGKKV